MVLVDRHIRPSLVGALSEARVVCLLGARQAGKTTLVRSVAADEHPGRYVSLDDPAALDVARNDPAGFVAGGDRLVIDEVQRAPDLLLAIKRVVDSNPARGQFLLTGSANILTLPQIADALPGRVDYMTLWPFSQAELSGVRSGFIENALAGEAPSIEGAPVGRSAYSDLIARGGFPEAVEAGEARRRRFFAGYADSILGREIDEVSSLRDSEASGRVLRLLAARSAALTNFSSIARELGIDHKTVANHVRALDQLFLVVRLPAWHANLGHRVIRSAKLHIADTGMLCSLLGVDTDRLTEDGTLAGAVFETFVVNEVVRLVSVAELASLLSLHHYRDRRGNEVDLVLEHAGGDVVGIEVKASATPRLQDAAGLALLRDNLGDRFRHGIVLHLGPETTSLGDRLTAVPLMGLWSG
ncbi:MAG TPA: ATP-binding protein [Solirubrobacterales bacterium]|nr:ATP-binding protein [Solirubrobacterales bacterium]